MVTTVSSDDARPTGVAGAERSLALAGFAGAAVSFGFGRFAYGALLPAMRDGLDISFAVAGLLQSVNLLAYLAGTLVAGFMAGRVRAKHLLVGGILGASASMVGVGLSGSAATALGTMGALGFCGGLSWIASATLVIERATPARRGLLLGAACAGSGWGILPVTGFIELFHAQDLPDFWRPVWWASAVVSAAAVFLVVRLEDEELSGVRPAAPRPRGGLLADLRTTPVPRILLSYLLFGLGASVFTTFALAALTRESVGGGTLVWTVFGLSAGTGALLIGRLSDAWGRPRILALSLAACGVATAVAAVTTSLPAMLGAAVLFGPPLIGVGVVVTSFLSDVLVLANRASRMLAVATLLFSLGQTVGPVLAGAVIDRTGSFTIPFGLAALATLSASGVAVTCSARRERAST